MKSKLLMLIIASFVFVGCTVDSKQRYQVSSSDYNSAFVLDTHTGEISYCSERKGAITCSETWNTHGENVVITSHY